MSELWGLPDFQAPAGGGRFEMFAAYRRGPTVLLPERLVVARRPDGRPDLTIVLARRQDALDAAGNHGAIDLRIARRDQADEALAQLRARDPRATLAPALFAGGWARLVPSGRAIDLPEELSAPAPIGVGGVGSLRWTARLALATAELLRGALAGGALLLDALAEVEVVGVAPRLPVKVRFDPAALLGALGERRVPRARLVELFLHGAPVQATPAPAVSDTQTFAEAMADRVRARFGRAIPSPAGGGGYLELAAPEEIGGGTFTWDLAEPVAAPRPFSYTLERLGVDAVISEVTLPALQVGFWEVSVSANLPRARQGVLDLGVALEAPARPPFRMEAVEETVSLAEPTDEGSARFRLAPREALEYTFTPFVALEAGRGMKRLEGAPAAHRGEWLGLDAGDFPVDFVAVSAAPGLLALATVAGKLRQGGGERSFTLGAAQPEVTLVLPRAADGATISVAAVPLDGGAALALEPMPAAGALHLDLPLWRGYGPQRVAAECRFGDAGGFLAVDLLPEGRPETPEEIALLRFTPEAPRAEWRYLSPSPFHGGYRFRIHEEGAAWSDVRPPSAPLILDAAERAAAPPPPAQLELRGVHLYTMPADPATLYYLPGEPTGEARIAGDPATLQVSARWDLDAALRAALGDDLARWPALAAATLDVAPVGVSSVELALGDGSGGYAALGTAAAGDLPPFAASLAVPIAAEQRARVDAALGGAAGLLRLTYHVALLPEVSATLPGAPATIDRVADLAAWRAGAA